MARICIVEDDPHIARMIEATLSIGGYESRICGDGLQAVEEILKGHYDMVLLDVMLPGMDGFEIIGHIRTKEIPVIFLTAKQEVSDKVKGLRLGAEDYIVKPFEAMELLARVEVVLRRTNRGRNVLQYRDIVVNIDEHTVKKGGELVALTPKEFDVLVFFLLNPDLLLTRERLLEAVWGHGFAGESRTVDIHVQQMRRKMGLQKHLITIPKMGYRLGK